MTLRMILFILCALPAAATSGAGSEPSAEPSAGEREGAPPARKQQREGEPLARERAGHWLPATCKAGQTVGMHRYPKGVEEVYMPAIFNEQTFDLREDALFMRHLLGERGPAEVDARDAQVYAPETVRLYVTMASDDGVETEFECRPVRGTADNRGYSCVNNPPSEMLLINPARGRYTRSSIGGWSFYAPEASLFVEYGTCRQKSSRGSIGSDNDSDSDPRR